MVAKAKSPQIKQSIGIINNVLVYNILLSAGIIAILYYVLKIILYFTPAIIIALLIIYLTRPLYTRFEEITKSRSLSILITMIILVSFLSVFIIYFSSTVLSEAAPILKSEPVRQILLGYGIDVSSIYAGGSISDIYTNITASANYNGNLSDYQLQIKSLTHFASTTLLMVGYVLIQAFISLMIAFYWVKDREQLKLFIFRFLPEKHHDFFDNFSKELDISLNHIIMSVFFTALFTSILSYVVFRIFEIPFSGMLAISSGIFSIIPPFGPWLVYIPIAGIIAFAGEINKAIVFFIISIVLVGAIPDWIARPFIMSKDRKTNLLIVFISILGGLAVFGLLGAFLGPIVMSIFTSFIYAHENLHHDSLKLKKD